MDVFEKKYFLFSNYPIHIILLHVRFIVFRNYIEDTKINEVELPLFISLTIAYCPILRKIMYICMCKMFG